MRTIICGGRNYIFTPEDRAWLDELKKELPITVVLHGAQKTWTGKTYIGADWFGAQWGYANILPVEPYPADWINHGRAAGPLRNEKMAKVADACIAFPGGTGTADMVRRATARGLKVIVRA